MQQKKIMTKVYRSRIGVVLTIISWGILLLISAAMFLKALQTGFSQPLPLVLFVLIIVFFGVVWFSTRYIIDGDWLRIKIGPVVADSIYIPNIFEVRRSYSFLSAPATSRKRLALRMKSGSKKGFVLVSPEKEEEFLNQLHERNTDMQIDLHSARKRWKIWNWDF